ncbi:MAG: hypothetical protein GHCLOJNM_01761 [bacterium]|nr:hypothetical protein [bacterium]
METTRLSSKGQIIIPKAIRVSHGWGPGVEFLVEEHSGGVLLRPTQPFPATTLREVIGCTGYTGARKSLAEMEGAIRKGVSRQR